MDSQRWNAKYPVGTTVILSLANGKRLPTRTRSRAERWGGLDHVAVEAIQSGYVLLSWCWPVKSESVAARYCSSDRSPET